MTNETNITLIIYLRGFITSMQAITDFRLEETDFTRERKLPFHKTVVLILKSWKTSICNRLSKFYDDLDLIDKMPSPSAFCQARQKLKPEFFIALKDKAVNFYYEYYEKAGFVKRWKGYIMLAIDGSYLNLPDTEETRKKYSIQVNQINDDGTVQALSSYLYDVLNGICVNAVINEFKSEKSFIFMDHIKYLREDALLILDRLYADFSVLAFLVKSDHDFVIRCPTKSSFSVIKNFMNSCSIDEIVEIKVTKGQKKFVEENGLPDVITVRLIKVILDNGEIEVLITSLLDREIYRYEDFKWLYHQRWCIETYFDRLKNLLEIERFSSKTIIGIEQDFYALIFSSTFESILIKEDEAKICQENHDKNLKYEYKINKSVSYTVIADNIVDLLLDTNVPPSEVLAKLSKLFKKGLSPERPGRKFGREEKTSTQKLRYHKYEKRVMA